MLVIFIKVEGVKEHLGYTISNNMHFVIFFTCFTCDAANKCIWRYCYVLFTSCIFYCKQHDIIKGLLLKFKLSLVSQLFCNFFWVCMECSGAYSKEWIYMHVSELILKHEVCVQPICVRNKAIELRRITVNPVVSLKSVKSFFTDLYF